jgi:hypothetical protein
MARSRINRQLQEKSMHTIILSILGSIAIILLLIFFGVPAIIKLGSALSHSDTNIEAQTDATTFIAPPSIDPLFSATNSATITVSGSSTGSYTIRLYNNDTFLEEMSSKDNGTFQFRNVHLKDGDNALKVIAKDTKKNKQSKDSEITHVLYSNKEPSLSIDYPSDGATFKDNRSITVRGKTDINAQVKVNGFQAVMDSNGGYSYNLPLHDGGNDISVVATDMAGNTKQQTIHINYN